MKQRQNSNAVPATVSPYGSTSSRTSYWPIKKVTSDIYARTPIKSLLLPIYESQVARLGVAIVRNLCFDFVWFREVSQVDEAFVQKVKHSLEAPGQLIKWHRVLSFHSFLNKPLLGPKLFCNTEKSLYSFRCCLAIFHSWNIVLLPVASSLWDSTEWSCVCIWPQHSHSCHFKSCFFVS